MPQLTQNKETEAFLIELFRAFFSDPVRFRSSTLCGGQAAGRGRPYEDRSNSRSLTVIPQRQRARFGMTTKRKAAGKLGMTTLKAGKHVSLRDGTQGRRDDSVRQSGVEPACGRQAPAALELGRGFECFCWKAYVQSEILLFRGIGPAALLAGFGT